MVVGAYTTKKYPKKDLKQKRQCYRPCGKIMDAFLDKWNQNALKLRFDGT